MKYKGFPISFGNNFSTKLKLPFSIATLLVVTSSSMLLQTQESKANINKYSSAQIQLAQTPVASSIIYVNPQTGTDTAGGGTTEAAAFKTINFALKQAQPGTVVQLAPGTYSKETGEKFPLRVKKGVTLRGDEAGKGQAVLITGSGRYRSRTFAGQNITILAGKNAVISGVTVTNPASRGTGIWVESTNPKIINNTFTNNKREGVFVTGTANPMIAGNIFIQNTGNGVSVAKSAKGEIRGNLFQDTGFGLAVGGKSTPLIVENQILQNVDGLFISNSAKPVLRKNVIQNNTRDGIVAISKAQPNLGTAEEAGGNLIRNNERYDVHNATKSQFFAIGNDIDESKIQGQVEFVAATVEPIPGGATAFSDVAPNYWAKSYIEVLASKGVIAGFPDGTFKPDEPVTRAQFAAIINKAFAPQAQKQATNFRDVSSNFWAYNAIQTATKSPFLAGYPNNTFRPQLEIPRVQVLVSLANGLGLTANNPNNILSIYSDAEEIPNWAEPSVAAATARQLVVNYPTAAQLNPSREATRAEVAAFVYQALVNAGQAEAIPSPYIVRVSQ